MENIKHLNENILIEKIGVFRNKFDNQIKFLMVENFEFYDIKNNMQKVRNADYIYLQRLRIKRINNKPVFDGLLCKNKLLSKIFAQKADVYCGLKAQNIALLEKYENKLYKKMQNKKFKKLNRDEISYLTK